MNVAITASDPTKEGKAFGPNSGSAKREFANLTIGWGNFIAYARRDAAYLNRFFPPFLFRLSL
jgi:hypothetical protein